MDVDTRLLRRLRFMEGLIMNILIQLVALLILAMPLYLGISPRLTAIFVWLLFICSIIFGQRIGDIFYARLFSFLKPLWEYEQKKLISDKWMKQRRNHRYFNGLMIIGLSIIVIYPPPLPRQIHWESLRYSITGTFVGCNIGMVWKVLTEAFYY